MKVSPAVQNTVNLILPALVISIKEEMNMTYKDQFAAYEQLNADETVSNETIKKARDELDALKYAIHNVSTVLDKEFKPKRLITTSKTALCPRCNHRISHPNHSYCHRCGQKLQTPEGSNNE